MCSCNDFITKRYIEKVALNTFDNQMDLYKKDIFSTLKYYVKYDPELVTFRNMSADYYNKMLDEKTQFHISKAGTQISKIVDDKIAQVDKMTPIDILTSATCKKIKPDVDQAKSSANFAIGLGIINLAGLIYLATK